MKLFTAIWIMFAYCAPSSMAAECPKAEYEKQLSEIGFKQLSSIESACDKLISFAKGKDDGCKDELIFLFRDYYFKSLGEYNNGKDASQINDENEGKLNKELAAVGWRVASSEGNYYVAELAGWPEAKLKEVLSLSYTQYFKLRSKEIEEGFSEDAGLLISWENLRNRIISWESFLTKFPNFVEKESVIYYVDIYLRVYLTGMDNSRVFDFEGNKLKKKVRQSYEKFILENKKSAYHRLISEYYVFLKKNKFVEPANLDEYLKEKGYKTFLAVQPPTY